METNFYWLLNIFRALNNIKFSHYHSYKCLPVSSVKPEVHCHDHFLLLPHASYWDHKQQQLHEHLLDILDFLF